MRRGIKRSIVFTVLSFSVVCAVPALAKSANMDDGYAYNNASYSGGLRRCSAGTINNRDNEYASLYVCTTYQDGTQSDYWSGIVEDSAVVNFGWESTEDYSSIHRLYTNRYSYERDSVSLSDG